MKTGDKSDQQSQTQVSEEERQKRIAETVKEVVANRRQGLSELMRLRYETEEEARSEQLCEQMSYRS